MHNLIMHRIAFLVFSQCDLWEVISYDKTEAW